MQLRVGNARRRKKLNLSAVLLQAISYESITVVVMVFVVD